jgi:hypothetical protein
MANIEVPCPHCKKQTWVRGHYNDPLEHYGRIYC